VTRPDDVPLTPHGGTAVPKTAKSYLTRLRPHQRAGPGVAPRPGVSVVSLELPPVDYPFMHVAIAWALVPKRRMRGSLHLPNVELTGDDLARLVHDRLRSGADLCETSRWC